MSLVRAIALAVLAYLAAMGCTSEALAQKDNKDLIPAKIEAHAATFPVGRYKIRTFKADIKGVAQGNATRDTNVCVKTPAELKAMMSAGIITTAFSTEALRQFGASCQEAVKFNDTTVMLEVLCEPAKPQKGAKLPKETKEAREARAAAPNHFSSSLGVVRGKEFQIVSRVHKTTEAASNFVDGVMTQVFPLSSECIASDETSTSITR
jgi:hypothetical protein